MHNAECIISEVLRTWIYKASQIIVFDKNKVKTAFARDMSEGGMFFYKSVL